MEEATLDYGKVRKKLHEDILDAFVDAHDEITGITGWILIVESASGPQKRSLWAIAGDIIGENDLSPWTARGWLDEVGQNISFYIGPDEWEEEDD